MTLACAADEQPSAQVLGPEDLPDCVHQLVRDAVQRITGATWTNHSPPRSITEAVADLRSGYSSLDMPTDKLREAAIAAGTLWALRIVYRGSVAEILAAVQLRDVLT